MDVKNRIKEALDIKGIRQVDLVEKTGYSKAQVSSWVNNRWQPKRTALHEIAKVLDVSEFWLAGYDVPMDRPIDQKRADDVAQLVRLMREDKQLRDVFYMFSQLSEAQRKTVEDLLISITGGVND